MWNYVLHLPTLFNRFEHGIHGPFIVLDDNTLLRWPFSMIYYKTLLGWQQYMTFSHDIYPFKMLNLFRVTAAYALLEW